MKTNRILILMLLAGFSFGQVSCGEDSDNSSIGEDTDINNPPDGNGNGEQPGNSTDPNPGDINPGNHDILPGVDVTPEGKCVDQTIKVEPGVCGCQFEDKDIDEDGKIDCPKLVIPNNVLPKLKDIPGKCDEWEYPKHHIIEYPKLPEYGYEVTIDTEKYNISRIYDISKADETTKGLNKAIEEYKAKGFTRIVIPPGHYPVTNQGLKPGNDVAIIMGNDVTLQMIPTSRYDCGIITISKNQNVYLEGGTLIGERYEHTLSKPSTNDEECGGMQVFHSGHIFINGLTIKSVHGDGILVLDYTKADQETIGNNIIIANCEIDDAFRNSIAVVGMDGIRISNNHIHHTNGTSPQMGIDFEPNGSSRKISRSIVDHNTFNDNISSDMNDYGQNTFIEYNLFDIGDLDYMIDNPFNHRAKNGTYIFYRNKVSKPVNNTGCSNQLFCSYSIPTKDGKRVIPDETMQKYPSFFVENDIPRSRIQLTYMNRICISNNVMHEGHLSFSGMKDVHVFNNRVEKFSKDTLLGDYSCQNIYGGKAGGNMTCKLDDSGQEVCTEFTRLNALNDASSSESFTVNGQWY